MDNLSKLFSLSLLFYATLGERQNYEICPICSWEDDGQDSDDADVIRGGPNGNYCLEEAQNNFTNYQTMYRPSDKMFTRENKTRALRMKLYNAFCQAMSSHLEQDWENALAIEKQI